MDIWQSPDERTNNQIDHVLVDGRHVSSIIDVKICRGAVCDLDNQLVWIKYLQKISKTKIYMLQDKGSMKLEYYRIQKLWGYIKKW